MRTDWPDRNFGVIPTNFDTPRPLMLQRFENGVWRDWTPVGTLCDFQKEVDSALFSCYRPDCRLVEHLGYIREDNARDKAARIMRVLRAAKQPLTIIQIAEQSDTTWNFVNNIIIGISGFGIGYDINWMNGRYNIRKLKRIAPYG